MFIIFQKFVKKNQYSSKTKSLSKKCFHFSEHSISFVQSLFLVFWTTASFTKNDVCSGKMMFVHKKWCLFRKKIPIFTNYQSIVEGSSSRAPLSSTSVSSPECSDLADKSSQVGSQADKLSQVGSQADKLSQVDSQADKSSQVGSHSDRSDSFT